MLTMLTSLPYNIIKLRCVLTFHLLHCLQIQRMITLCCIQLTVCLTVSIVAIIVSLIALALYYIDIGLNLSSVCIVKLRKAINYLFDELSFQGNSYTLTNENSFFKQNFSAAVKNVISILIMVQTAVSSAFTAILYKVKNNTYGYTVSFPVTQW